MTKVTKIYLDLDDVLNSFSLFVLGRMGCPVGPFDYHLFPDVGYDIHGALRRLNPDVKMTVDEFWRNVRFNDWAMAPVSNEASAIIEKSVEKVGRNNVFILTKPTRCPESCSGKLEWIQTHMPRWLQRQFVITPKKGCCARPDSLLIDDNYENLEEFWEAGGRGLLMPRPWNYMRGADSLNYVLECLETI